MKSFIQKHLVSLVVFICSTSLWAAPSERLSFNADWRFQKDDPAEAKGKLAYAKIKAWLVPGGREFTTNQALLSAQPPTGNPGWRRYFLHANRFR